MHKIFRSAATTARLPKTLSDRWWKDKKDSHDEASRYRLTNDSRKISLVKQSKNPAWVLGYKRFIINQCEHITSNNDEKAVTKTPGSASKTFWLCPPWSSRTNLRKNVSSYLAGHCSPRWLMQRASTHVLNYARELASFFGIIFFLLTLSCSHDPKVFLWMLILTENGNIAEKPKVVIGF